MHRHGHSHLHRRQHHHRQRDDPFGIGSALSSIEAQAASLFGIGPQVPQPTPSSPSPPGQQPPSPAQPTGGNPGDTNNNGPSIVYVTASRTFTGAFSLSTMQIQTINPSLRDPQSTATDSNQNPGSTTASIRKTTRRTRPTASTDSAAAASATAAAATATAATLASILDTSSITDGSSAAATSSAISSTSSNSTASPGLSGGAKAGIAIGVILGILALAAGAFALWRMKKNRDEEAYEIQNSSEKNPFSDSASTAALPPIAASMATYPKPAPQSALASNPFGSGAVPVAPQAATSGPMPDMPGNVAMALGAGAAGLAAASVVGAEAANARRASVPPPLNLNRAQSPALVPPPVIASSPHGSNFSESSTLTTGAMAAVGGAGAGAPGGPRMHRVQMDFNPTMEDELQISAGEIVRIVREFDDGWCSVEIMQRDAKGNVIRNQAGVVPRTCLSRLPLKPRQKRAGPPPPPGSSGPQMNPSSGRVQSPALAANHVQRSMSPGPYGGGPQDRAQRTTENRSRSNSANDISSRPRGPPIGPSPMNPASQTVNPAPQGNQNMEPFVAPLAPSHTRDGSASSTPPSFARKPVPGKTDA